MTTRLRNPRTATATAAGAVLLLGLAAPAAHAGNRTPIGGDHEFVVVAECADGAQVDGTLDGEYSEHWRFDKAGSPLSLSYMMEYKMTWTLSSTGESVYPHGTRHIVFDYVDGTLTDTGNYRTLTVAGEGRVLKKTGREVLDMATWERLSKSGPDVADIGVPELDNPLVCGLFGVDGA